MDILNLYLPRDIVNIIDEYSKDRTQYNRVIMELDFFQYVTNIFLRKKVLRFFHRILTNPYASIYDQIGSRYYKKLYQHGIRTGRVWVRLKPEPYCLK